MNNEIIEYCNTKIEEMNRKAEHNKSETLWSFKIIMLSSLLVPLFISFGDTVLLSKVAPSILSAISAFLTAWLQLRKPNQLWTLYRTAHRELENELKMYQFKAEKYSQGDDLDKRLIEEFSTIYMGVNEKWSGLVPTKDDLSKLEKKTNK